MNAGTAGSGRIFLALLRRDLRVARRELPSFLVRTTMQPLLRAVQSHGSVPRGFRHQHRPRRHGRLLRHA